MPAICSLPSLTRENSRWPRSADRRCRRPGTLPYSIGCHFEWRWVTLSDLVKYLVTWSMSLLKNLDSNLLPDQACSQFASALRCYRNNDTREVNYVNGATVNVWRARPGCLVYSIPWRWGLTTVTHSCGSSIYYVWTSCRAREWRVELGAGNILSVGLTMQHNCTDVTNI